MDMWIRTCGRRSPRPPSALTRDTCRLASEFLEDKAKKKAASVDMSSFEASPRGRLSGEDWTDGEVLSSSLDRPTLSRRGANRMISPHLSSYDASEIVASPR